MAVLRVGDILNPAGYTPERVLERLDSLPVGTVSRDSSGEYWLEKLTADTYEVNHPGNDDSCGWDYSVMPEYVAELIARVGIQELLNAPVYKIEKLPGSPPKPFTIPKKQRVPVMSNVEIVGDDEEPVCNDNSHPTYLAEYGAWTGTTRFTIDVQDIVEEITAGLEHMPVGEASRVSYGLLFRRVAVDRYEFRSAIDPTRPPLLSGTMRDMVEIAMAEALHRVMSDPMKELMNLLPTAHVRRGTKNERPEQEKQQ